MLVASLKLSLAVVAAVAVLASGKPIHRPSTKPSPKPQKLAAATPPCDASNAGSWACIPDRAECYSGSWHSVPCEPGTVCQGGLCIFGGGPGVTSSVETSTTVTTTKVKTTTTTTSSSPSSTSSNPSPTSTSTSTSTSTQPSPSTKPPPPPPSSGARFVTYVDATSGSTAGSVFAVPGSVAKNAYNVINLAFWQSYGPWDAANVWSTLDAGTRSSYIDAYHKAGVRVLVSAFGAAEWPTTAGVNPETAANNLATFVKENGLDGADIDWEDNNAMEAGTGEAWLITFMKTLRGQLPKPYIISHAPQAPYFIQNTQLYPQGGYLKVNSEVGDLIDFYNVQFYNQGDSRYDTCDTLLSSSGGSFPGTSLFEIVASGIDENKIVLGKPVTQAGASNTGYMDVDSLATCLTQAHGKGWDGGVMGWQFSLDPDGSWINTLASAME